MKPQKIKKYKASPIKTVFIFKANGKFKPLRILTIKDRAMQILFKLVMEAYLEPLGNPTSFGFRPGRGCQHAIAELANRFRCHKSFGPKSQKIKAFGKKFPITKKKSFKKFYVSQTIIEGEIKKCFDNISHKWLVDNVPMPENYEYILLEFLKAKKINSKDSLIVVNKGVLSGEVISPLLINLALDGIGNLIEEFAGKRFVRKKKIKYLKYKGLFKKNKTYPFSKNSVWFVRYLDDFIISLQFQPSVYLVLLERLKEFLKKRGLEFSEEKTLIKKQKIGHKFDFLG